MSLFLKVADLRNIKELVRFLTAWELVFLIQKRRADMKGVLFVVVLVVLMAGTALGSVTLNWTAPAKYTDGTNIASPISYNLKYGVVSGTYTTTIPLGVVIITYSMANVNPGTTYYFVVTAVVNGVESLPSNEVVKAIPFPVPAAPVLAPAVLSVP
jgi:hypothetical protein